MICPQCGGSYQYALADFYVNEERIEQRIPTYRRNPPSHQVFWDDEHNANTDLATLLKDLTFP